jgi:undecaprenyl-phosphate galactose phosphotransferase
MSVVNRIPRSFPFDAAPGDAQAMSPSRQHERPRGMCNPWCAAGIVGADTMGFVITSLLVLSMPYTAPGPLSVGSMEISHDPLMWGMCAYAGLIGYFASRGHYEHRNDFWTEAREIAGASVAAMVLIGWAAYMLDSNVPRPLLLAGAMLFPLLTIPLRQITKSTLGRAGFWRVPVVVVGSGAWGGAAADALRAASRLGYHVVGQTGPGSVLGSGLARPWARMLRQHGARLVVLAFDADHRPPAGLTESLVRERVPFAVMPHFDGLPIEGLRQTRLASRDVVLQTYRNNLDKPVARATKVAFDLVVASVALVILAPLLVLIAASVSLDGGPVLFGHKRIGAGGKIFTCLKFRSMAVDGDRILQRLLADDTAAADEWTRTQKLRIDPRVTWIGRILRKTSLDELPQLLNVLRLDMSLVGPRPIVSMEIPKYAEDIAYYYETRPGITGLWQVSGRSDTTYAQRVRLDSWYVKNWTIGQDLAILFKTIPAVVSGRGAG